MKPANKPIKFRQSLFWDVNPRTINPKKHARYIIERILDFGNDAEIRWLVRNYPQKLIREVMKTSNTLHDKSRALWNLLYP